MDERKALNLILILVVSVAVLYTCYRLIHILTPFILSFAAAYVVNPAISALEARGVRRSPVVITIYLVAALLVTVTATSLIPIVTTELQELQEAAPTYLSRTQAFLDTVPKRISRRTPIAAKQVEIWIRGLYDPMIEQIQHLPGYLMGLFPILSLFILVPFITFFLLVDANKTVAGMIQACPSRLVEQALYLISEIDTSLGNYLRGIIIESIVVALMAYIGLSFLGVGHGMAISALAGMSCFVPYLGAVIGAIVGAATAVVQFGDIVPGLKVIALFAGIRFIDDWLLQPIILKHSVDVHPLVFLLSLMVGAETLGFMGLVLAVPVACVVKSLIKVGWDWYATEAKREVYAHIDVGTLPYT